MRSAYYWDSRRAQKRSTRYMVKEQGSLGMVTLTVSLHLNVGAHKLFRRTTMV